LQIEFIFLSYGIVTSKNNIDPICCTFIVKHITIENKRQEKSDRKTRIYENNVIGQRLIGKKNAGRLKVQRINI